MGIISTNQWLEEYRKNMKNNKPYDFKIQREALCEKLKKYFHDATGEEIHEHLLQNGLFLPGTIKEQEIKHFIESDIWKYAKQEFKDLRKDWMGPDVPVFVFPVNIQNRSLLHDFNGKSGLAFEDKVFLFVTSQISKEELKALLTHEYNHVCRLNHSKKTEQDMTLLDSIVLEGMAEMAVKERVGTKYMAKWASIYSKEQAEKFWNQLILPNEKMKSTELRHFQLMYGQGRYPKWCGYNVGAHLVSSFCKNQDCSMKELLKLQTREIVENSTFNYELNWHPCQGHYKKRD